MRATNSQSRLVRWGFPEGVRPLRESALVVVVIAPLVTLIYELWDAHWRIPFDYTGDGLGLATYTKGMIESGWYLSNPRLAAPFTADFRDFPLGGENAHWLALKVLGVVTGNYATAINLYFVLSFFAIALVTYFVVRYMGFSVPTALVVGTLYAFLPYHAWRGIAQLPRGAYYPIPLAVLVIVWLSRYRQEFLRDDDGRWRVRRGRLGFALAVAVLIGCTDDQNSAYLASLLGVLALVIALRDRDWRPLALAAIVSVTAFGTLLVNNVPFVVARLERGPNAAVADRSLHDQDYYALRPVNLVLPAPGHRIKALADVAAKSAKAQSTNNESGSSSLGLIGSIGLIASVGSALGIALGARSRRAPPGFLAQLGVLNLIAILIGMMGGLSFLIALAGFRQYRTWNRVSLFIALFSLLAAAVGLERGFGYLRRRFRQPRVGVGVLAVVVAVIVLAGALDQTTPKYVPGFAGTVKVFDNDAAFYHALENMVPPHSMVFQLPISIYPEPPVLNKMPSYEELTAYLQTKTLRWSYGGINGRNEGDWQKNLDIKEPLSLLAQIAAVGFVGVVVNRSGFADGAAALMNAAAPYVGAPKLTSTDQNLEYLDLTGLHARLENELGADALTQSSRVVLDQTVSWTGFAGPEITCAGLRRWVTSPTATIELDNTSGHAVSVTASASFVANPAATHISLDAPGDKEEIGFSGGAAAWSRQLVIPPGKSKLRFRVGAGSPRIPSPGDPRTLYFGMVGYKLGGPFDSPVQSWAQNLVPPCKPVVPVPGG